jgi:hypothetical protein
VERSARNRIDVAIIDRRRRRRCIHFSTLPPSPQLFIVSFDVGPILPHSRHCGDERRNSLAPFPSADYHFSPLTVGLAVFDRKVVRLADIEPRLPHVRTSLQTFDATSARETRTRKRTVLANALVSPRGSAATSPANLSTSNATPAYIHRALSPSDSNAALLGHPADFLHDRFIDAASLLPYLSPSHPPSASNRPRLAMASSPFVMFIVISLLSSLLLGTALCSPLPPIHPIAPFFSPLDRGGNMFATDVHTKLGEPLNVGSIHFPLLGITSGSPSARR